MSKVQKRKLELSIFNIKKFYKKKQIERKKNNLKFTQNYMRYVFSNPN